jgi:hypothetical protein
MSSPRTRGPQRERRALGAPAALCAKLKKHTSIVTTVTPETPGIPRAMVLTVSFVLFPVTGLVCHRRKRNFLRKLDASVGASEPHDFAVRARLHKSLLDGLGTSPAEALAKADQRRSSCRAAASTASRPAFVTIASRPSVGQDRIAIFLFLPRRQVKF